MEVADASLAVPRLGNAPDHPAIRVVEYLLVLALLAREGRIVVGFIEGTNLYTVNYDIRTVGFAQMLTD